MKNGFQEALNKKDEKWSESHAVVRGGAQGCATQGGWGPLNQFIQRPQGDQLRHPLTPLRALGARWRIPPCKKGATAHQNTSFALEG